jgi:hypothetical protein
MGMTAGTGDTFTITTTFTASTASTYTITFTTGTTAVPEEPKPKPKSEKETFDELVAGMKFKMPELLPPKRYGTCIRCSISVDVSAFQGRCSACGGPLANR